MGETENIQHDALMKVMESATQAMKDAEAKIHELRAGLAAIHQLALDLPCSCWINQPKCPVCQMVEMSANG
jgi:DNA repair exonuclease SbcCD ATPase subunit